MRGPLLFLAALSALGGLIGVLPGGLEHGAFHQFLSPVVSAAEAGTGGHKESPLLPYLLMAVTTGIGVAGWFTAHYFYYVKPEQPDLLMNRMKGAYTLLLNKYWVDELYDRIAVEPSKSAGRHLDRMDTAVVDRAVVAVEQVTDLNAAVSTWFEKYVIYGVINVTGYANHIGARLLRQLQTGLVHHYAAILVTGLVLLVNLIVLILWWGGAS
jgi:NADH-quinone oxidoreductase subunit L